MMRRPAFAAIAIALALSAIGQARAATPINKCGTTITKSGSYVLKKNLTLHGSVNGAVCIAVASNYVAIDLGGYTIDCGGGGLFAGITDNSNFLSGIVVRNGFIAADCFAGVYFSNSSGVLVDHVSSVLGADTGIDVGTGSSVIDSITDDTGLVSGFGMGLLCPSTALDSIALVALSLPGSGSGCSPFNVLQ